ncbi:MAG: hypothetical protein AAF921_28410 [Cyanobacteria bacterium P01_D01_bin.44]
MKFASTLYLTALSVPLSLVTVLPLQSTIALARSETLTRQNISQNTDVEVGETGTDAFETETYAVRLFYPNAEAAPYMNLYNKETSTLLLNEASVLTSNPINGVYVITNYIGNDSNNTINVEISDPVRGGPRRLTVNQDGSSITELEQLAPISATQAAFETETYNVRVFQRVGQAQHYMNVYNRKENTLELDSLEVSQSIGENGTVEYRATLPLGVYYVVTGREAVGGLVGYQLAIIESQVN